MKTLAAIALLLAAAVAVASAGSFVGSKTSIGSLLERDYTVYKTLPTTAAEAEAMGWKVLGDGKCQDGLGIPYTQTGGNPDQTKPLWLYFTPGGQASGAAVMFYDHIEKQKKNLIDLGFIVPYPGASSGVYYVSVGFRSTYESCSSRNFTTPLGDRLVINPQGVAWSVPVTAAAAQQQGWVPGSCFAGMGRHWFLDLSSYGSMTWQASQMLPIVTMYDEESADPTYSINAFFFASSVVQQSLLPLPDANQWEPIALPNFLMCKNFCNSSCTFHDTDFYSTLHIYMNPRARVTCNNGCTTACCGN